MNPMVIHASAALAWMQEEPGTQTMDLRGAKITALDWGCVLDYARIAGQNVYQVAALLHAIGIRVEPVLQVDVLRAAEMDNGECLADRIATAVANRLGARLVTSESLWNP